MSNLVAVAVVRKTFGLKGEVKVQPLTDSWDEFLRFPRFFLRYKNDQLIEVHVETVKFGGGHLIIKFKEFSSRDESEEIRGSTLLIPRDELPAITEPDTYYYSDILGMQVFEDDEYIGTVEDIHRFGPHETLEILQMDGTELLLPFVRAFIQKIDLNEKKIYIKTIPGLK